MSKTKKHEFEEKVLLRLERLEKKMDLLDNSMQEFGGVEGRLRSLEEQSELTRKHTNEKTKDIKDEIQLANDRTVAKVETVVEGITDAIETKKVIPKKKSWWKLLLGR